MSEKNSREWVEGVPWEVFAILFVGSAVVFVAVWFPSLFKQVTSISLSVLVQIFSLVISVGLLSCRTCLFEGRNGASESRTDCNSNNTN